MSKTNKLDLKAGTGLVVANMIGAGVFLSTGFMAQDMPPTHILAAWVVGGVLAICGARAYAEVARLVPHSGGEYRYLSTLMHPSIGAVAGWASLVVGFAAPVAIDALAAGAFVRALGLDIEPRLTGTVLVLALTATHVVGLRSSARIQNLLVAIKLLLMFAFIVVGFSKGTLTFPTWTPAHPATSPVAAFAGSLFYIAFAYSGWNAAAYAADEFEAPERQVPKAMVLGAGLVTVIYVLVNVVFVFNLTPAQGAVVFNYDAFSSGSGQFDQVTLGQTVMAVLLGTGAAKIMSGVMVLLFTSAISAMTLIGPRVASAMAKDKFMWSVFAAKEGQPPVVAIVFQGVLVVILLWTQDLRSVLSNVGALLTLFAALTMVGLLVQAVRQKKPATAPTRLGLVCAVIFIGSSIWMLHFGLASNRVLGISVLTLLAGTLFVYLYLWFRTRRVQ